MNALDIWLTIAGLTAVTFVTRCFFLLLGDRVPLPERVQQALRYAPVCALVALIVPEVLLDRGALALDPGNAKLAGALAAALALGVTRNVVATMAVGMAVFTAVRLW